MEMVMKNKRVAIIGAGPSGIAQLRAFESAEKQGHEIPELVCFEKQDTWGGQWNYSWRTGTDSYGEPVHSSMYRNLWSNGPKEVLEFAEYSFDEHFGKPISSYPPREVLWDCIAGRAKKSNVEKYIKFAHVVRWVSFDEATKLFTVTVENLRTGETSSDTYDNVIVGAGHFSFPNVPHFDGVETFPGQIMHAHEFRGAEAVADKDILLIGASYSAEDIGTQAYKMGARSVTFSYRSNPMGYEWPEEMTELPLVERFDGSEVHFVNGEKRKVDIVVFCTGYLHHYPFMPSELTLSSPNNLYPDTLYRGVVSEANNQLFWLGAQDQWLTFNMFDAQAWYVRDVILGRVALPSKEAQRNHMDKWLSRFEGLKSENDQIDFQCDYVEDLIDQTDYPSFDLKEVANILKGWVKSKEEDILNYRDYTYTSVMTGTTSVEHHTPWMIELDDSLERYLSEPQEDEARQVYRGKKVRDKA